MRPVLAVFIDGLKYSSVAKMPFLDSMSEKRRVRTDLGYSVTCHATMYSGVFPEKHNMWFLWKYDEKESPYKLIPSSKTINYFDCLPARLVTGYVLRKFYKSNAFAGLGIMKNSSLRNWKYFAPAEKKFWSDQGYLGGYRTMFEVMRSDGIDMNLIGFCNSTNMGGSFCHVRRSIEEKCFSSDFNYVFLGEVDHVSHVHGQESDQAAEVLKEVDSAVRKVYEGISQQYGKEPNIVCWSDHGHMMVEHQYDIYRHFQERGTSLGNYIHLVDTNYARFWFRDEKEQEQVNTILSDMPVGFILTNDHLRKYNTVMPDNRYGDLIFYLDWPYMFQKTVWGYGRNTISIHGYLPDYPDKDGVVVSNTTINKEDMVTLADISPSILALMDTGFSGEIDGRSLW